MGITVYSVASSIIFFNIALIAAFVMRRSNVFLAKQTTSFLLFTILLGVIRLLIPIDSGRCYIIRSTHVLPAVRRFLNRSLFGPLTFASLLLTIWIVGTLAFLFWSLIIQVRFVRASRNYQSIDRPDLVDIAGEFGSNYGILVSPSISRPYVSGLFRPIIYLPDIDLPEEQWRVILRHEVQHIRSHDEWKKLFFLVIQALFWWNPLAHISRAEIDTLIELQCDAKVTAGMSAEEVDAYLETLKSLKSQSLECRVPVCASALVWDQKQLLARFEALQDAGFTQKRRPSSTAYLLLLALFVSSYFVIIQPAGHAAEANLLENTENPEAVIVVDHVSAPDDLYILYQDGHYYLYSAGVQISEISEENLGNTPFSELPIIGG